MSVATGSKLRLRGLPPASGVSCTFCQTTTNRFPVKVSVILAASESAIRPPVFMGPLPTLLWVTTNLDPGG